MFLRVFAILCWHASAVADVPFGIFHVRLPSPFSPATVYVTESQSIFGPVAFLSGVVSAQTGHANHMSFWRAVWRPSTSTFFAEGFTRKDVSSIEVIYLSEDRMRGEFITTDDTYTPRGEALPRSFPFEGERYGEETALRSLAERHGLTKPTSGLEAEGIFSGRTSDGTRVAVSLRSHLRDGQRIWMASYRLGAYPLPMTGYADSAGLLHLVRTPTSSPSELSALTATVAPGSGGDLELHGFFFVPRNNRLTPLVLKKTRNVSPSL